MEKQIKKELPKIGNAEYVETVVNYLCRRKRSIEVDKIAKALGKTYIDPRRMIFYTSLGFLELSDGKLKVTRRGRELYKADSIERKQTIYLDVLRSIEEYRQVLGYKLNKPEERHLLVTDVLKYWHARDDFKMQTDSDNSLREKALCFLRLCESAGLGKITRGRNGKDTKIYLNWELLKGVFSDYKEESVVIDISPKNVKYTESDKSDTESGDVQKKREILSNDEGISYSLNDLDLEEYIPEDLEEDVQDYDHNDITDDVDNDDVPVIDIRKETIQVTNKESNPFVVSFKDGRQAVLFVPKNINSKDAKYIRDCINFILDNQFELQS